MTRRYIRNFYIVFLVERPTVAVVGTTACPLRRYRGNEREIIDSNRFARRFPFKNSKYSLLAVGTRTIVTRVYLWISVKEEKRTFLTRFSTPSIISYACKSSEMWRGENEDDGCYNNVNAYAHYYYTVENRSCYPAKNKQCRTAYFTI